MAKVRRIFGTAKKKARNFRRICREYVVEHKNMGLRNEKERKGMILRNHSES
jgi:hypothetical protein